MMLNHRLIYKILGSLLFLETVFMTLCLIISIGYGEDDILSFTASIFITVIAAFILRFAGRDANNNMSRKDAFLVVTLTWCIFSLFGTLPYIIGGYIPNFTNAYFETMSGFTTTGASVIANVEHLPHGILFWRSFTQWIGGLGIVFFTVAILPSLVGGSMKVFAAESTGPIKTKLHPRLSTSAQSIWVIFLLLTIMCLGAFKALGMDWFDSVNYAMTTIATGGFATHNDGILFVDSPMLEYVATFFCFISGVNFILLYRCAFKRELKTLLRSSEVKYYSGAITLFSFFIMLLLITANGYDPEHAFRSALYQVVSFMTTTGLFNDDISQWPHVTWIVLAICMFMGGCAGSTSGGFKSIRCLMLTKVVRNECRQMLHPKAVIPLKLGEGNVPLQRRVTLLSFLTAYVLLFLFSTFIMTALDIDLAGATTITLSSLGNVGPTLSTGTGNITSWNELPDIAKWTCSMLMLMGRLEIFSVLVIFTREFWKE